MALEMLAVDWRQKPNSRERIMFFAAMAACCLGFFRACWSPSAEKMTTIRAELEKVKQEKVVATQLGAALAPSATPSSPGTPVALTSVGSLTDVQQAIDTIAQPLMLKGVQLVDVKVEELQREGNLVREKVELKLVGSFYAVAEYLELAENLPAPLVIEDFSIASKDDRSGKVTTTIKGSFYGMVK